MSNTGENSPVPVPPEDIKHEDVFLEEASSEELPLPYSESDRSSFTLAESDRSEPEQLNLNKVLHKLGLVQAQAKNSDVRHIVNNVVSNFIEIDNEALAIEHEESFRQKFQAAAQAAGTRNNKYIYVSEYEDIEYLEVLG